MQELNSRSSWIEELDRTYSYSPEAHSHNDGMCQRIKFLTCIAQAQGKLRKPKSAVISVCSYKSPQHL